MKVQIEAIPAGSGTDGWATQVAGNGVPTGSSAFPEIHAFLR